MAFNTKITNKQISGATAGTVLLSDSSGNVVWGSLPVTITREDHSSEVNGVNKVFTLAYTPAIGSEEIYLNGVLQNASSNDYSIVGNVITFVDAPMTGFTLLATYNVGSGSFPAAGGAMGAYLPLAGGTLTGPLAMTDATTGASIVHLDTKPVNPSYIMTTNFGIGTDSPAHKLDVAGDVGANNFVLNPTGISGTSSGIIIHGHVGEPVAAGSIVYLNADGLLYKANGVTGASMPAIALAASAGLTGEQVNLLVSGIYSDDSYSWTPGQILYVSATTPGALTATAPSGSTNQVQRVGVALTPTSITFIPTLNVIEVV